MLLTKGFPSLTSPHLWRTYSHCVTMFMVFSTEHKEEVQPTSRRKSQILPGTPPHPGPSLLVPLVGFPALMIAREEAGGLSAGRPPSWSRPPLHPSCPGYPLPSWFQGAPCLRGERAAHAGLPTCAVWQSSCPLLVVRQYCWGGVLLSSPPWVTWLWAVSGSLSCCSSERCIEGVHQTDRRLQAGEKEEEARDLANQNWIDTRRSTVLQPWPLGGTYSVIKERHMNTYKTASCLKRIIL